MFTTKDPYLLLSIVNMKLRDEANSFEDLCKTYDQDEKSIIEKLESVGYTYDQKVNQFVSL